MRIFATASVGSHLETIYNVEKALRAQRPDIEIILVDIVGFFEWDATHIPYRGRADRIEFRPETCGLSNGIINSSNWRQLQNGALHFVEESKADFYLTIDDSWYSEYSLLLGAKKLGLPTLLIQEGPLRSGIFKSKISLYRKMRMQARRALNRVKGIPGAITLPTYGKGGADKLAVASSYYSSLFRKAGVPENKLAVTGIPRYDALLMTRQRWLKRRGIHSLGENLIKILLLSQPFLRYKDLTLDQYSRLCGVIADGLDILSKSIKYHLTIRLHPSETIDDINALKTKLVQDFEIQKADQSITAILQDFDIVLGFFSCGILEALAIGIPGVSVGIDSINSKTALFSRLGVPVASSPEEIAAFCKRMIASNKCQMDEKGLFDEMGHVDGRASERVASLCLALYGK